MLDNKKAQSLYKKLGFEEIGVIRQGYFDSRTGDFQDVVYMDLLKNDWLKLSEFSTINFKLSTSKIDGQS